ncbi:MAG: hypothetical protein PHU85_15200 [Phycisphaerae bacterium]|nr:hypothetical protein [Phycisphaerae bacterium]
MAAKEKETGKESRPERQERQEAGDEAVKPARKLPMTQIFVALGVLAMEAATVGVMMWVNRGPAAAHGQATRVEQNVPPPCEDVEELIIEGKAANTKRGATYVYKFKIHAVLSKDDVAGVKGVLEKRKATIDDSVRQVVARLDPKDLDEEPGLVTFRRVLMAEMEPLFGAGKIKQLLVPEWGRVRVD